MGNLVAQKVQAVDLVVDRGQVVDGLQRSHLGEAYRAMSRARWRRDGAWLTDLRGPLVRGAGPRVTVQITDRGQGIAPDELDRIFDAFPGTGESAGTGLGLAIARGFVEANGGRIRVESPPGHGATFTVQLPVAAGQLVGAR
jgi:signal transduction histidine kinase